MKTFIFSNFYYSQRRTWHFWLFDLAPIFTGKMPLSLFCPRVDGEFPLWNHIGFKCNRTCPSCMRDEVAWKFELVRLLLGPCWGGFSMPPSVEFSSLLPSLSNKYWRINNPFQFEPTFIGVQSYLVHDGSNDALPDFKRGIENQPAVFCVLRIVRISCLLSSNCSAH